MNESINPLESLFYFIVPRSAFSIYFTVGEF